MASKIRSAIDFYDRHPISAQIILAKLEATRGTLEGLQPDDLFPHDQDHYGGLAANDALAKAARIGIGSKVVDLCAGLGGPARYLAHRFGAIVTGIELTPARVAGAAELSRRVGLNGQVRMIEGNVMDLPLADASQDAVISQEALLHVPDIARAFAEAHRVLRPGGRIAFTNWVVHRPLPEGQRQLLWDGMAAATLIGIEAHAGLLRAAGFEIEAVEDETPAWGTILGERLRMYEKLRGEAEAAGTPSGHDDFYRSYVLFVDLVQRKEMGGARFTAVKQ
ncbi:methyltransferase domain-containing protein [Bradyrhizobium lablabi]|uniref:class I SAM-dependent methyltransferase n=1 Tax=Bradyrhizobium lablabi TaxID=722472 RepID=UPI001BAE2270|nr:class I SAM-dependent methyltransferase [Bradyrhizobium lablabi]MBR1120470.1 methyltransferase domain-containing protein [Bradyrhizobium lablabi]